MPRPRRPLIWLLGGYALGLVAARTLPIGPAIRWPAVIGVAVLALLAALVGWIRAWRRESPWAHAPAVTRLVPPLVALVACGLGAISLSAELRPRLKPHHVARQVEEAGGSLRATLEARVVNAEGSRGTGAVLLVEAEALSAGGERKVASGRVLLRVERGVVERPAPGDRVKATASLRFPRSFRNPGGYDARAQLALRQVRVVGAVRDWAEVVPLGRGGFRPRTVLEALRDRVRAGVEGAVRGPAADLLRALLLGEDDDLPRELREAFQATGTYHVVSISGLHMALVAAAGFAAARALLARAAARLRPQADARRTAALAALAPVLLYMLLAGGGIAAVRAALMASAVLLGLWLGRRLDLWSAVALAALLVLAFYPGALFELGFLLSFGAVAAILRLGPWLAALVGIAEWRRAGGERERPALRVARDAGAWGAGSMVVSAAAGLGTGPLLAFAFGRLNPWAPLANLIVVPLVGGLAVGLGLLGALVALVHPPWAAPIFQADAALLDLAIGVTRAVATWPASSIPVPAPTLWEVALAYAALWALPAAWPVAPPGAVATSARRGRFGGVRLSRAAGRAAVLGVGLCLVAAGAVRAWPPPAGTLRMTFLDVGAGETALLELPGGERILVDGGAAFDGGFDVGERVVTPFLLARGVRRLDVLVLTQPRPDRQGGLAAIARAIPVGEVWVPAGVAQVRGELGLVLADRRVPIVVKRPEDPARVFGPAVFSFLPGAARLAFRLGFRGVALVVPPDGAGAPPPAAWAPKDGPPLPGSSATILQWPRSPLPAYGVGPLLDALRPQVVVVPGEAGRRAARELPELLDVIEVRGARALVPARDGAVVVSTDGTRVEVRTVDRPDPLEEGL